MFHAFNFNPALSLKLFLELGHIQGKSILVSVQFPINVSHVPLWEEVDAAGIWWGFPELSSLVGCTVLLGVEREVMAFNVDYIMPGWTLGSSNSSFTISIPEPSDWLILTWCFSMALVGWSWVVCLGQQQGYWTGHFYGLEQCALSSVSVWSSINQFDLWPLHESLICVKGEWGYLSHLTKLIPQWMCDNILGSLGIPLWFVSQCWIYFIGQMSFTNKCQAQLCHCTICFWYVQKL